MWREVHYSVSWTFSCCFDFSRSLMGWFALRWSRRWACMCAFLGVECVSPRCLLRLLTHSWGGNNRRFASCLLRDSIVTLLQKQTGIARMLSVLVHIPTGTSASLTARRRRRGRIALKASGQCSNASRRTQSTTRNSWVGTRRRMTRMRKKRKSGKRSGTLTISLRIRRSDACTAHRYKSAP